METVFDLMKKRVADKYELGDIKGLEARGFDQYPTQPQPTSRPALPELAKVTINVNESPWDSPPDLINNSRLYMY